MIYHLVLMSFFIVFGIEKELWAEYDLIQGSHVMYDVKQSESIQKSITGYLSRYVQKPADEKNLKAAENFLKTMYFISQVACQYKEQAPGQIISCAIKSKRIIGDIKILNLPSSMLQEELKRKMPIQVGYTVDFDSSFNELLDNTKTRVETFLKKNGFYGAEVNVTHQAKEDSTMVDISILITNGVFARVNQVVVTGDSPLSTRSIKNSYQRMCLSFSRIIESFFIGTLSCYSRELERETTQALQEKMAKLGFVQARIRLTHHWIELDDKTAEKSCQRKSKLDQVPHCVNLRVHIEKGPKVTWAIKVKDNISISRNAFLRFLSNLFSVDQFSRATIPFESDERALGQAIIKEELLKEVTFIASKNVDEYEISESQKEIRNFLASRGYINAEVVSTLIQKDPDNLLVNFDVYAGRPQFIKSVRIYPETYMPYIGKEKIENWIPTRSFFNNGHISHEAIENARDEMTRILTEHGFTNILVSVDMESSDNQGVDVVFYVKSESKKNVSEIIVKNGYPDITEKVLPALYNCDKYAHHRRDMVNGLCHDSSLVLGKLEDDANRLADFYQTNGYLYAKVQSEVLETKDGFKLIFTVYDSRYDVSLEKPLRKQEIKDIIISGNVSTNNSVIRRLFPKDRKSGALDPISLKKGLANLRESGRFSRIDDRKIMAGEENSDDVYFLLHVTERPSLSLDVGMSFSTENLFMLEAEIEESNFLSSMLKLNTSLGLGLIWGRQSIFNNKIVWPFVFGKPLRFTIQAPTITYDDHLHYDNPHRRLQSKVSIGLDWRVTNRIMPYIKYWLVLNQEQSFTAENKPKMNFSDQLKTLDGLIPTINTPGKVRGVLRPGLSYTKLDNPFNPRSGVDMNFWTEISGGILAGNPSFINIGTQNRFFIPIGPLTLAIQASFMRAFIEPNEENWKELRNGSSMDSLGGDRSVRGYREGSIGIYEIKGPYDEFAGYLANTANIELRFPITTQSSFGNFSGALFVDQGMLIPCSHLTSCFSTRTAQQFITSKGFGLSVGASLRYSLPVGPLSLDYGISPITGDGRIHLLFGYAF